MNLNNDNMESSKMQDIAQDAKRQVKNQAKNQVKKAAKKVALAAIALFIKILPLLLIAGIIYTAVSWILEIIFGDNTSTEIYEVLEITDLSELVEIKGNESSGYYLDYKDGTDEKLEDVVDYLKKNNGVKSIELETLKKMIKAEVITQYPNLGKTINTNNTQSYGMTNGVMQIPSYYMSEWNIPFPNYPDSNVSSTGCGFVSIAMVMSYLTQSEITPQDIVSWGYRYYNGQGADGALMTEAAKNWNTGDVTKTSDGSKVLEALREGKPVISLQNRGVFTQNQHYIVLKGINSEGKILVNDPASPTRSGVAYDFESDIDATNALYWIYEGGAAVSSVNFDSLDGFLFIGDSITQGLEQNGNVEGSNLTFRGVVSSNPGHWLNDESVNGVSTYSTLPADSDDIKGIVMMLGTNNISQASQMEQLIEKVHNKYPDKVIFVQKILPLSNYDVSSYNSQIEAFCSNTDYTVFIDSTAGVEISSDGTHPSSAGYATLAGNTKDAVLGASATSSGDSDSTAFQGAIHIRRITPNKAIGEVKNTGTGVVTTTEPEPEGEEVIQDDDNNEESEPNEEDDENQSQNTNTEKYKVGIMGGHSTGSTGASANGVREEVVVREVATRVEQLFSSYSNIEVVQVGSTSTNTNVPNAGRLQKAIDEDVDLLVSIHLNAAAGGNTGPNGVSICYNEAGTAGDGTTVTGQSSTESHKLGDILKAAVSSKLGLGTTSDFSKPLSTIGTNANTDFPSVIVEGGFLTNPNDAAVFASSQGVENYAKGIVDGILEYLEIANTGYGDSVRSGGGSTSTAINSRIKDLKYLEPEKFDKYVENNEQKALDYFTLDDTRKLIVARWSYSTEEGLQLSKSSPINYLPVLQKYTMPYEYLIDWLIDSKSVTFVESLADLAIDSEFVIAIEDNVTTTQVIVDNQDRSLRRIRFNGESTTSEGVISGKDWHTVSTTTTVTESVSLKIELTYADAWFVRFQKDTSYSTSSISTSGSNLTGSAGASLGNYKITSYCAGCNSPPGSLETSSGAVATVGRTIAIPLPSNGGDPNGLHQGSQVIINGNVFVVEDVGGMSGAWIDVFVETGPNGSCGCTSSPWNGTMEVFLAENVTEAEATTAGNSTTINAVANVPGTVKDSTVIITQSNGEDVTVITDNDILYNATVVQHRIVTTTRTITNKYDTGESRVFGNEQKFIDAFQADEEVQRRVKPKWLYTILSRNYKTVNMVDLTKYLIYLATGDDYGVTDYSEQYEKYRDNEFRSVGNGTVSYDTLELTDEDIKILEKITYAERGNGTQEQQEYVVSVILNRVLSVSFPNTVKEVVFAPYQFEPTRNGSYDAATPTQTTKDAVANVIENGDTSQMALYFMTPGAALSQSWLRNCIYLFNDTDEALKDQNQGGSHNFYTTEVGKADLSQYVKFGGGTVVQNAVAIHQLVRESGAYSYDMNYNKAVPVNPPHIDCSSYVSWVLLQSGFEQFRGPQKTSYYFEGNPDGWEQIGKDSAEPGDVLAYPGHVEIYAGEGRVYNMGSNNSINAAGTADLPESSDPGGSHGPANTSMILRAPVN